MLTARAVKTRAAELGFDLCGVARAEHTPRLDRLSAWIADGHAGEMHYLERSLEERLDPRKVLPSVRAIVSLGTLYNTAHPYSCTVTEPGRVAIARYAWGDDYHDVLRGRLRGLVQWMADTAGRGFEAFSCVDNGPVQERVFAEQAGLGWIGKNTCLINPRLGSWIFLAEVFVSAALDSDEPGTDLCGTCTRCIDACPTAAIPAPYVVDATRCLSYLTIEQRGPVDDARQADITRQIAGCDICQDVCPWNRRGIASDDPSWQPREGLMFPKLLDLCRMSDAAWRERIEGGALRRAGLTRIRRSLGYAAAALPEPERTAALDALAAHAE